MSGWPDCLPFPRAVALLHDPDSEEQPGGKFSLESAAWPNLDALWSMPLHIIKVCAVAIHRDELEYTPQEEETADLACKIPGYEFSGYVVSGHAASPFPPGTEV